jgi:hypothetical protein
MGRNLLFSIALSLVVAGLILNGCAVSPKPKPTVEMSTPFNEADFAPYAKKGSGAIIGQAFLKTVGGDVKYGAGSVVYLFPQTPYVMEFFTHAAAGKKVDNIDLRAGKYSKKTMGDGQGNFGFNNLPAGEYILITNIEWGVPTRYGIEQSGGDIVKSVTLKDGEKVKVMLTR